MYEQRAPFGPGDVVWVESVEYPPTLGYVPGYELWLTGDPLPAPSVGFWLVAGWELAAGTQGPVRLRMVCVPTATPCVRRARSCASGDAVAGWSQPTQPLPIVTPG